MDQRDPKATNDYLNKKKGVPNGPPPPAKKEDDKGDQVTCPECGAKFKA